jgi:hypothetical protein
MNKTFKTAALCMAAATLFAAGCKKTADNTINYKSAIDTYYAAHPACLWSEPQKFPVQVTASDTDKTSRYDALFDQGLLTRTAGDKKKLLGLIDKQVTNYDLSDKGRDAWTPDTTQPGLGNFCYGHRNVANIDSSTPNSGEPGATTLINYHWGFSSTADWAKSAEVGNVYPAVRTNLTGSGTSSKTLLDTSNGWQVQKSLGSPVTPADGSIVE